MSIGDTEREVGTVDTATCFGCGDPVADEPGTYYCPACVVGQLAEAARERQAFDNFHAYADEVARRTV